MQAISAACFLGFLQPCFQCPSKGGQGIPREIADNCPGHSIHQRGHLLHCFLPSISLDFPFFWTLGYCTFGFAEDKYHYTARTARFGHFFIHFVLCCKGDKKVVENSGHPLLEEQKHFLLGSQTSACLKLPLFWTCQHCEISSCLHNQSPLCPLARDRTSRKQWAFSSGGPGLGQHQCARGDIMKWESWSQSGWTSHLTPDTYKEISSADLLILSSLPN